MPPLPSRECAEISHFHWIPDLDRPGGLVQNDRLSHSIKGVKRFLRSYDGEHEIVSIRKNPFSPPPSPLEDSGIFDKGEEIAAFSDGPQLIRQNLQQGQKGLEGLCPFRMDRGSLNAVSSLVYLPWP
jgi:hypothetical protein